MDEPTRQDETKGATTTAAGASNKLFLGGLSWTTTEDTIRDHFGKYGELLEVIVMRDRITNKPRGFGFVTFKDQAAADKAFKDEHVLDGRTIDAKPSLPHGEHSSPKSKKIFVGGLAPETTDEVFRQHFEAFGKVVEAQIMVDHTSGRSRGFGFITFAEESSVASVFSAGSMQEISGKRVEVKTATPKGSGPVGRGPVMSMPGRGLGFGYPPRGIMPGRYPGEYGWAMHPGYMPMASYPGYMPYGAFPGMMMGGYPMQYGGMGYPMQQQSVPGVMSLQRQQSAPQQYQQQDQRGQASRAPTDQGSSRQARRQQQQGKAGASSAEAAANLPDHLNPTADQQQSGASAASS